MFCRLPDATPHTYLTLEHLSYLRATYWMSSVGPVQVRLVRASVKASVPTLFLASLLFVLLRLVGPC